MSHKGNAKDAARRAFATFVAGATAAPLTSALFDVDFFKAAAIAGVIAVWNFAGRWAQYELTNG
ncbi:MAG TPA: hypothetical protein VIG24_12215 [Acidimicrobiia bacterium]